MQAYNFLGQLNRALHINQILVFYSGGRHTYTYIDRHNWKLDSFVKFFLAMRQVR